MRKAGFVWGRAGQQVRRELQLEPLEERRMLAANATAMASLEKPWHNDTFRYDVDADGSVNSSDLLETVNEILLEGTGPLPVPPPEPVTRFYDTTGDNRLNASDLLALINGLLTPPDVTLSMFANFTADLTPEVTVSAATTGEATLPNGALVEIDLDLNRDGDFGDPGERGHTTSTLWDGQARFFLNEGLQYSDEVYQVHLQARVQDSDGVRGQSQVKALNVDTRTSSALEDYVNAPDDSYQYHQVGQAVDGVEDTAYKFFVMDMTSQTWRSDADVNLPAWHHWLEIYVPYTAQGAVASLDSTGLLFIRGGSNTSNPPNQPSSEIAKYATANQSVVAVLRVVPNEPVVFTDETQEREEDEIIAYTLNQYLDNIGAPGNDTWPLLLPMVKSAVRAMDTVQDFVGNLTAGQQAVDDFVVSGESKRGWTTWLTAAADDRVRAIMPGVFDNLNQAPQMVNHYAVLGKFSEEVEDYTNLNIFERILTPEAQQLGKIVDPYSYLHNGRFDDMPKLILNSAGDEFFVPDSSRFYFQDLPGDQNYMRYIPNTGHGLDERAVSSRRTFYDAVLHNRPLPEFSWTVEQDGSIHVQSTTAPSQVLLWQKTNPDARDFRNGYTPGINWFSSPLTDQGGGTYVGNVDVPASGATAYLVELTFPNSVPGADPYVFTTEARIKSPIPLAAWPYASPLVAAQTAASSLLMASTGDRTQNAIASALAIEAMAPETSPIASTLSIEVPLADAITSAAVPEPNAIAADLGEIAHALSEQDSTAPDDYEPWLEDLLPALV
jgi:PhoPQ-activated pathogenicity-related protein